LCLVFCHQRQLLAVIGFVTQVLLAVISSHFAPSIALDLRVLGIAKQTSLRATETICLFGIQLKRFVFQRSELAWVKKHGDLVFARCAITSAQILSLQKCIRAQLVSLALTAGLAAFVGSIVEAECDIGAGSHELGGCLGHEAYLLGGAVPLLVALHHGLQSRRVLLAGSNGR